MKEKIDKHSMRAMIDIKLYKTCVKESVKEVEILLSYTDE